MHSLPRIQDLPAAEIARLLEQQGHEVPAALVADLKVLIEEIDGIDNARSTVEPSGPQRKAA